MPGPDALRDRWADKHRSHPDVGHFHWVVLPFWRYLAEWVARDFASAPHLHWAALF